MNKKTAITVTTIFSTLGVLFFISIGFDIMPRKYASFAGVACFIISGAIWGLVGTIEDKEK